MNKEKLKFLIKEVVDGLHANNASSTRDVFSQFGAGGYDFADVLKNIYSDFGYPSYLDFFNYINMYKRFGIAKSVVELYPDSCWSSVPKVEGSDQFNSELKTLTKKTKLWVRLKGLDVRQRVGRYGGIYMRVSDGKKPSEPLVGTFSGNALVDITPLYESQLEVTESDTDFQSSRYGQPIMYNLSNSAEGSRNVDAISTISIHYTRVIIAAEGADNCWIYGIPALECVYNSLMDLRKIAGAGGEGFYKNAAQSIVFNLKDTASASNNRALLDEFNESYDDFAANRQRRAMWTPGMDATVLSSSLADPKNHFMNSLNDVAAGAKIPATILIGQQTGRLASTEDSRSFLGQAQSRRQIFLTDLVESVMEWLLLYGFLPKSEYEVEWDDLLARSVDEKLSNASRMSEINERQFRSGGRPAFDVDDIRVAGGFEVEDEIEILDDGFDLDE